MQTCEAEPVLGMRAAPGLWSAVASSVAQPAEPQERMGTHWDGCATEGGPRHYDCAVAAIAALRAENADLQANFDGLDAASTDERRKTHIWRQRAERYEAERDALAELVRCADTERQKWGSVPAVQWDDAWAAARAALKKVKP